MISTHGLRLPGRTSGGAIASSASTSKQRATTRPAPRPAFRKALELDPRLAVAHKFYANLEADLGQSQQALVRLLRQANRHGNDPELFAGLVHACRYCGLFEQSVAAHAEARRLDPHISTGFEQTLLLAGEIDRMTGLDSPVVVAGVDDGIRVIALGLAGRRDEAQRALTRMRRESHLPAFHAWTSYLQAWLDRRIDLLGGGMSSLGPLNIQEDPEAIFQEGWLLCEVGEHRQGLPRLERAVARGTLSHRPWRTARTSTPCGRIRISRRSRHRLRQAASRRSGSSARPGASSCSAHRALLTFV